MTVEYESKCESKDVAKGESEGKDDDESRSEDYLEGEGDPTVFIFSALYLPRFCVNPI